MTDEACGLGISHLGTTVTVRTRVSQSQLNGRSGRLCQMQLLLEGAVAAVAAAAGASGAAGAAGAGAGAAPAAASAPATAAAASFQDALNSRYAQLWTSLQLILHCKESDGCCHRVARYVDD